MLHGAADQTVPIGLGRRLRDAARPGVRWVEVPGGTHSSLHNQAPETYQQAMKEVINGLTPASSSTATPDAGASAASAGRAGG